MFRFRVFPVPCLQDNYAYLLASIHSNKALAIDPVEPEKVLKALKEQQLELTGILTTHHHQDHSGGNLYFHKQFPNMPIYGGDERIPGLTHKVHDGEKIKFESFEISCLLTKGHTSGHICYHAQSEGDSLVFTGDTLFIAGCGRFFEGSPEDMYHSLIQKLNTLPPETRIYCGHEYTKANLQFAASVEHDNPFIKEKLSHLKEINVPSLLKEERQWNPFMRVHESVYQEKYQTQDAIEVMRLLREAKNKF